MYTFFQNTPSERYSPCAPISPLLTPGGSYRWSPEGGISLHYERQVERLKFNSEIPSLLSRIPSCTVFFFRFSSVTNLASLLRTPCSPFPPSRRVPSSPESLFSPLSSLFLRVSFPERKWGGFVRVPFHVLSPSWTEPP